MKEYRINFWYYTDLRCDATVNAPNEIAALSLALVKINCENWCDGAGFRIEISLNK